MKRLLVSSLLGCMLMSQVQAMSQDNALAFFKGASLAFAPLAVRGVVAAVDCGLAERASGISKETPSLLWYLLPSANPRTRALGAGGKSNEVSTLGDITQRLSKPTHCINQAENQRINLNRLAALFSGTLFFVSLAKVMGWQFLPSAVSNFMSSDKFINAGIAAGSAGSLLLLAKNLTKPKFNK
jgi:hypothetical protein